MAKYVCMILLGLILQGCSTLESSFPEPIRDQALIVFNIVDEFPIPTAPNVAGYAVSNKGICEVYILRKYYPYGVTHEVSHCVSDNWHEGRSSSEWFYFIE